MLVLYLSSIDQQIVSPSKKAERPLLTAEESHRLYALVTQGSRRRFLHFRMLQSRYDVT